MLLLNLLQSQPIYALGFIGALIFAITIHEFAHAWAATRYGDPTPKYEGRLTLNPLSHLDPLGTIFLLLAGFGWGKPVPINPNYFRHKSDQIKVAMAGIVANILLAAILAIPLRIYASQGIILETSPVMIILDLVVQFNLLLAAFNLLPIPPLDGSYIVEYFLSEEAKLHYQFIGPYILISLLLMDRALGTSFIESIMQPILNFLKDITGSANILIR
jgi:Zn-dependent protease